MMDRGGRGGGGGGGGGWFDLSLSVVPPKLRLISYCYRAAIFSIPSFPFYDTSTCPSSNTQKKKRILEQTERKRRITQ